MATRSLEALLDIAAGHLPEGHSIKVYVENGYGDATLTVDGEECEPLCGQTFPTLADRVGALLESVGVQIGESEATR